MSYVLALDAGTTSVRALIFDREGQIRAAAQKEIRQIFPQPAWVEHGPREIWFESIAVAIEAMGRAGLRPRDLEAVGIASQRETTVLWDRESGEPVHNAIVWQDRRTADAFDKLRAAGALDTIRERTGLLLDAYFSATKLAWLLDHVPGARVKAEAGKLAFGTVDSWLVWNLTSGRTHITDVTNASRTLLFNIHTGEWDQTLLTLFGIPASVLPEVRAFSEVYGDVSTTLGLNDVPIGGMAGDQQAALFGQMCIRPGLAKNTYGTGCFLLEHTGRTPLASKYGLLTTVAWKIGKHLEYAQEGSVFIGGAAVQWLRDGLKLVRSVEEVDQLATSVKDSGGVLLVPAFAGLGAPHWDPYARGLLIGITRDTTAAHLARATLEGGAFQIADLIDAMRGDTGTTISELRVDGGASRSEPLMQFQADILGVPVVRPSIIETTALDAAYLAGLAVGFWKDPASIASQRKVERVFEPHMPPSQVAERRARWSDAVERAKAWETGSPRPQQKKSSS